MTNVTNEKGMVLLSLAELDAKIKEAYQKGYADAEKELSKPQRKNKVGNVVMNIVTGENAE